MDAHQVLKWKNISGFFLTRQNFKNHTFEAKFLRMITFEDALNKTLAAAVTFGSEQIGFEEVNGRVLFSGIRSDSDVPPFNKSAMDGFACRKSDLMLPLKIIEVIPAGSVPEKAVGAGECSQIMTGAIIPEGADTVIKVEDVEFLDPGLGSSAARASGSLLPDPDANENREICFTGGNTAPNICYRGEDLREGQTILEANMLLASRHVPIMATVGATLVEVYKVPRVAVLSTGSELVEPYFKPSLSQIRNSNAYQLVAQLGEMGIDPDYLGIAPDDPEITGHLIDDAFQEAEILLITGGVSMGDFDFVPDVLEGKGFNILFRKMAVQPGKPTLFGAANEKFVFGLPGNPVSSYFIFEMLVKPFIYKCMGHNWQPPLWKLQAAHRLERKNSNRLGWIPVGINGEGRVVQVDYHGSAHICALKEAQGIASMPIGTLVIEKGELVNVRPI